jgi:hypothetical protein
VLQLVEQLEHLLADVGALAFTFIDPDCFPGRSAPAKQPCNDVWIWKGKRGHISQSQVESLDQRAQNLEWFTLVNRGDLYIETEDIPAYEPEQQETFHVFHPEKYMRTLFPQATILPPVNREMQHCRVIRKG